MCKATVIGIGISVKQFEILYIPPMFSIFCITGKCM